MCVDLGFKFSRVSLCLDTATFHHRTTCAVTMINYGVSMCWTVRPMPASDASAFQLLKEVIEELYADRIFVAHVVSDAGAGIKKGLMITAEESGIAYTVCMVHSLQLCMGHIMRMENTDEILGLGKNYESGGHLVRHVGGRSLTRSSVLWVILIGKRLRQKLECFRGLSRFSFIALLADSWKEMIVRSPRQCE